MIIIKLNENYLEAFKAYCRKYKRNHDESYLYDEDIEDFKVDEENPTHLLLSEDKIIGCISLMFASYFVAGKKTRVRIFHCIEPDLKQYEILFNAAFPIRPDLETVEMFLPNQVKDVQAIIETFGFNYYRTSYVMIRKDQPKVHVSLPEGYVLKPIRTASDEECYCEVRNEAFRHIKGSETPITTALVKEYLGESYLLKDGMQLLWHADKAVGVIRMIEEIDETGRYSFVAPIALKPSYQGKGLGKLLLKLGIEMGQKNNFDDCMLVVNAENEKALSLYQNVGFETDMAVSCYTYKL